MHLGPPCIGTAANMATTSDEPVPPFDPKGNRYDQRTYQGRLRRFKELTDPRMLLVGDDELAKVAHKPFLVF